MKNNGKPSKTKENEKKNKLQMKKKMKIWTQSCRFSLRTRKSSKTGGNFHLFLSFVYHFFIMFFHFPCPWHLKSRKTMKIRKTMENHQKQRKMKKK
jgi:hypothetical protein